MARTRGEVGYDVYVLRDRRWELHAHYGIDGRVGAIMRAKYLGEQQGVRGVKVVRETLDNDDGLLEERIIFQYSHASGGPPAASRRAPLRPNSVPPRPLRPYRRTLHGTSPLARGLEAALDTIATWSLPAKIAVGASLSFAGAALAIIIAGFLFQGLDGGPMAAVGFNRPTAVFLSIIVIFLVSVLVIAGVLAGTPAATKEPPAKASRKSAQPQAPHQTEPTQEPTPKIGKRPAAPSVPEIPPPARETWDRLVRFMRFEIQRSSSTRTLTDSHSRFGMLLFFAGACEACAQHADLDAETTRALIRASAQGLGTPREQAETFARNHLQYLISESRYMTMFGAGRDAMQAYLGDWALPPGRLSQALETWSQPKAPSPPPVIAIMFTEVVDLDHLLARHGDSFAQTIMRLHNRMVGEALAHFGGKKIKHTGNGIMATFENAANAANAAAAVLGRARQGLRDDPELAPKIRIGLNCGNPIADGNDLFGAAVQLAARLCETAGGGEALATEAVQALCREAETAPTLIDRGPVTLKGFSDPVTVYAVIANDETRDRPAGTARKNRPHTSPPAAKAPPPGLKSQRRRA